MTPRERIAALADIIASQEDPDPGCGCETCAWNNNLNWLLRVARAAVEWREAHAPDAISGKFAFDNIRIPRLIAAVDDREGADA